MSPRSALTNYIILEKLLIFSELSFLRVNRDGNCINLIIRGTTCKAALRRVPGACVYTL